MSENWYKQTMRKIHFDMHTPESAENVGRDFDSQAFADSIKQAGAQAVCFFARCAYGWSYYPTKVGLPHPHLKRDVFGDGVKAMKKAEPGKKIIQAQREEKSLMVEVPDFVIHTAVVFHW